MFKENSPLFRAVCLGSFSECWGLVRPGRSFQWLVKWWLSPDLAGQHRRFQGSLSSFPTSPAFFKKSALMDVVTHLAFGLAWSKTDREWRHSGTVGRASRLPNPSQGPLFNVTMLSMWGHLRASHSTWLQLCFPVSAQHTEMCVFKMRPIMTRWISIQPGPPQRATLHTHTQTSPVSGDNNCYAYWLGWHHFTFVSGHKLSAVFCHPSCCVVSFFDAPVHKRQNTFIIICVCDWSES